jgi:hypothetical protein
LYMEMVIGVESFGMGRRGNRGLASAILGLGRFQCNPSRDRLATIAATSSVTPRVESPSPTRGGA